MLSIRGIGPKLASLWGRIVHGDESRAVIDTHVRRWLKNMGYTSDDYDVLSEALKSEASARGISLADLDRSIVENGIRARKGIAERRYIPLRTLCPACGASVSGRGGQDICEMCDWEAPK